MGDYSNIDLARRGLSLDLKTRLDLYQVSGFISFLYVDF